MGQGSSRQQRQQQGLLGSAQQSCELPKEDVIEQEVPEPSLTRDLMKASFHAYKDGNDKPYILGLDRIGNSLSTEVLNSIPGAARLQQLQAREEPPKARGLWPWCHAAKQDVRKDDINPPGDWVPVAFINATVPDTQLWVHTHKTKKQVIVAFRGTSDGRDWLTDLNFKQTQLRKFGEVQDKADTKTKGRAIYVHEGFYGAYSDSVGDNDLLVKMIDGVIAKREQQARNPRPVQVSLLVRAGAVGVDADGSLAAADGDGKAASKEGASPLAVKVEVTTERREGQEEQQGPEALAPAERRDGDGDGRWHVYVTGHSLGGALATLAVFKLAKRQERIRTGQEEGREYDLSMYTYGAPRVGDQAFADAFHGLMEPRPELGGHRLISAAWRMVSPNDLVPSVPLVSSRYCHVGRLAYVYNKELAIKCDEALLPGPVRWGWNLWRVMRSFVMGRLIFKLAYWHSIYTVYLKGAIHVVPSRIMGPRLASAERR